MEDMLCKEVYASLKKYTEVRYSDSYNHKGFVNIDEMLSWYALKESMSNSQHLRELDAVTYGTAA